MATYKFLFIVSFWCCFLTSVAAGFGGVVACEAPLASYVGVRVLDSGGNAVDASVSVAFSLAVLVPHLGGFGGDFFALISHPDGRVLFLNGSGYSPRRLSLNLLESKGLASIPLRGPLSITIPGFTGAVYEMWRRLGSVEWSKLLEPARILASIGFPVLPNLARAINIDSKILELDPGSKATYLDPKPSAWEPFKMAGLASLIEYLQEDPRAIYRGEPAEAIASYVSERGGVLDVDDMKSYEPEWGDPLTSTYRGWTIYEMPPNTQGVTTLHILKLLEELSVEPHPLSTERFKTLVEVAIPSYKWRDLNVGDPRSMKISLKDLLSNKIIEDIKMLKGDLNPREASGSSVDTTFFAVADREGLIVAGIQSLYYPFGSGLTEPRFQVTLNNRAADFSIVKGLPNTLEPLKKPLHTLSAAIIEREDNRIALGASGGHYRPQQHAIFITNIIDYNMPIEEAINTPRAAWDPKTGRIAVEREINLKNILGLETFIVERLGVANAVQVRGRMKKAATDRRGYGIPVAAP